MIDLKRLTVLSAVLVAGSLVAQESVGSVLGSVSDGKGNPISDATIVIKGAKILGQRTITSNDKGEFRIPLLPPGDYTMNVSKEGWIGSRAEFRLFAGQTLRQDFGMKTIDVKGAEVEVVATAATVDKTETKTSSNLTLETLQALPLGLSSYATLALSPGVSGATSYPVVRGGLTGQTQFTVNGISVRDGVTRQGRQFEVVIDDMTEDISVIQSPLNARLGNASGGIVNLVTKSGTNEFQGSIRAKLSKDSWGALRGPVPNRYPTSSGVRTSLNASDIQIDDLQRTYEVSLLGPIVKDHLTFAYAARFSPSNDTNTSLTNLVLLGLTGVPYIGVNGGATDGLGYTFGVDPNTGASVVVSGGQKTLTQQYKLFWMISQSQQLEFFYTDDKLGPPYFDTQSSNIDAFATFNQTSNRSFAGINYRGTVGSNGIIDVRYGKRKSEIQFSSGPYDPINVRVYYEDPYSLFSGSGTNNYATGYSGGTVLSNGDTASPKAELRQTETANANYNWFNGNHDVDVGVEQLKETSYLPDQSGPNRQLYFSPGRSVDGRYLVFNYFNSPLATLSTNATTRSNQIAMRNASAWIPERQVFSDPAGVGDLHNYDTTTSAYINDLWTLNSHWSVMGGLRWDQWKDQDAEGVRVKSSAVSPRFEAKWDIFGNVQHLLNLSYAQFRGTISQGNLGGFFARRPGQIVTRNFYNVGAAGVGSLVDQATFMNPANYAFYTERNNWKTYQIDPDLKPEVAHEVSLGYRRAFGPGGFFRTTASYRKFKDLWYRKGINAPVAITPTVNGFGSLLTTDPQGRREYKGVEFEWQYPVIRRASQSLNFQGSWTLSRTYATETWREGNVVSSPARFINEFATAGLAESLYNPYGEMPSGNHNLIKLWLTWNVGSPTGIRNTVSVLARYSSGSPFSVTNTGAIPAASGLLPLQDMNSTYTIFYSGRGGFAAPDTYTCDLQWNTTVPIKGKLQAFSYLSINNVFNSVMFTGVTRSAFTGTGDPRMYRVSTSANTLSNYGRPSGTMGLRSVNIDLGIRF